MHDIFLKFANHIGIVGVVLTLVAYLLLSIGKWQADTLRYQLFNFVGSLLILVSLYFYWNLSSALIEIAWVMISMIGIYRAVNKKT